MSLLPARVGDNFPQDLIGWSNSIGIDPLDALKLFLSESGLTPSAFNTNGFPPGQGAVGINQLSPGNWAYFMNSGISLNQYRSMTADQQLPYAFAYWSAVMNSHGLSSVSGRDLYWLNFLPAFYVPGADDSHVIVDSSSGFYGPNASLDHGGKGAITAGDLQMALDAAPGKNPQTWAAIAPFLIGASPASPTELVVIGALGLAVGAWGYIVYEEYRRAA